MRQLTGYRAFLPAPLPPDPPVRLEGELYHLLSQADRALGRLDGSIQTLPNPGLFGFIYVRELIGATYPAANNLVSRLADRGIIREFTGQKRNRVFRYEPYIALFNDNPPGEAPREDAIKGDVK